MPDLRYWHERCDALVAEKRWGFEMAVEELSDLLRLLERQSRVLLDIEASLLAYWTDMPEEEVQRLRVLIRETLGDFEPSGVRT